MKLCIKKALALISVTLLAAAIMGVSAAAAAYRENYIVNGGRTVSVTAKKSSSEAEQNEDSGIDPQFFAIGVLSAVIVVDVTAITVIICKRVKSRKKTENKQSVKKSTGGQNDEQ